jgi:6,7-dimethyl-8-ribityllumazine synthase
VASEHPTRLPEGALDSLARHVGKVVAVSPEARGLRVGVACSRFNGAITLRLLDGALEALEELGADRNDVTVAWAPGAFELPLLAQALARAGADAVLCLGAVVRGETGHYEHVAGQCAAGIQRVQLEEGVPVAFGVLTTENREQALARSQPGDANKGREAAETAVEMARLLRAM